jgi:2-polyprenyl-3-methyl-5-hydroxy-6-metoxy-1,4-benzoquinol methylase
MDRSVYERMADVQSRHWWFVGRKHVFYKIIKTMGLPGNARILEIGAGAGANLEMLSKFGSVVACEHDESSRDICMARGWKAVGGLLPDELSEIVGKYDLICLFDVLEHVEKDSQAINRLKGLLVPNGSLLIACPAYQWLYGDYDRVLGHFRRYTSKRLATLLKNNGYLVVRNGYCNAILFPLSVAGRILELFKFKTRSDGLAMPPAFLNNILSKLFIFESLVAPYFLFPIGTTVVVHARLHEEGGELSGVGWI